MSAFSPVLDARMREVSVAALSLQLGAYDVFGEGTLGVVFPQRPDKLSIVLGTDGSAYMCAVLADGTYRSAELSPDESIRDFLLMVI